jgi:hypothetical protein
MSDLTNSINLLITNEKHLTYEIVEAVIARLSRLVGLEEIPVLMYPRRAAEKVGIDFRTTYCLWSHAYPWKRGFISTISEAIVKIYQSVMPQNRYNYAQKPHNTGHAAL